MKKLSCIYFLSVLGSSAFSASKCQVPGPTITWVMHYCAYGETGDEIAILESACFKSAEKDDVGKSGFSGENCVLNEKYKKKLCEKRVKMEDSKSVDSCMKDQTIQGFVAGDS